MISTPHSRPFAALFAVAVALLFAASTAVAKPAPDWKLNNLDGTEVSSADFKGKVVVVDFWATWCGPCVREVPGYVDLQKKYGKDGLVVVGISLDRGGPARVQRFVKEHDVNYTILMGDDAVAGKFGGIEGLPTTFLIDREGNIVHSKMGAWPHDKYEALVKKHL